MTDSNGPKLGEVWEDAEGALMTFAATDTNDVRWWWVFGVAHPVPETNPKVAHPLRRVFLSDGTLADEFVTGENALMLRYPNGSAIVGG